MEATLVPKHGYDMAWVSFSGVRGRGAGVFFPAAQAARRFLAKRARDLRASPDVILGMGGYISFPGGMMAALLGKALVVHEQNAIPALPIKYLPESPTGFCAHFPERSNAQR